MNLSYLNETDKQLNALSSLQNGEGAAVRTEIKRRKAIGYWDGSLKTNYREDAEVGEYRIMATPVAIPTARKEEKRMAGRGR